MTITTQAPWGNVLRGVAFGDSWGYPNEFQSIDGLLKKGVIPGLGPDLPDRLRITDDTQMTLYLAKALNDSWGADMVTVKQAIAANFKTYQHDPQNNRAPGTTVMGSLGRLSSSGLNWKDATSPSSDGSGTVMRTSPCAFLPEDRWVGITAFAAAITHGTANAIAAAILNVAILRNIMAGRVQAGGLLAHAQFLCDNFEATGNETGEWLEGYKVDLEAGFAELARLIEGALKVLPLLQKNPWDRNSDPSLHVGGSTHGGGGWRGHETLVIALLAIDMFVDNDGDTSDCWMALRRSVTTDGDSDTIGAVTGGLLGAAYPGEFYAGWNDYSSQFEKIYVTWIEEADSYFRQEAV